MNFSLSDKVIFARLDHVYNRMRMFQARSNAGETPCVGSGNCCHVGLQIHMVECAYIANHIQEKYFLVAESDGVEAAEEYINGMIDKLTKAMYNEEWDPELGVLKDSYCVFYDNGCTIYEARAAVCRSYGTTTTVDSICPRKRSAKGEVHVIAGDRVKDTIQDFIKIMEDYEEDHPECRAVVYMPLGVLRYLLTDKQMIELREDTEDRFWRGSEVYNIKFVNDYR